MGRKHAFEAATISGYIGTSDSLCKAIKPGLNWKYFGSVVCGPESRNHRFLLVDLLFSESLEQSLKHATRTLPNIISD
jgi:hypothetical protein